MSITHLDAATLHLLGKEIEEALRATAERHNVGLSYAGGRFSSASGTIKLAVSTRGDDGAFHTEARDAFARHCRFYGLSEDDLGRQFTVGGHTYTVEGLSPRSRKYPVLCERVGGKMYKMTIGGVRRGLGRSS